MTQTDYPDWQTPQAHADTISNTGVPLLARPANLVNHAISLGPGSVDVFLINAPVSKIGYEISWSVFAPNTQAALLTCLLTWSDSVSGQQVIQEEWDFYAGSGTLGSAHVLRGSGPTKGDTLTVQVKNNAGAVTVTGTVVMAQNSRVYARDDWRSVTFTPVFGFTSIGNSDMQNGIIGSANNAAVAANGSVTLLLPLFSGKVALDVLTTSNAADCETSVIAVAAESGGMSQNTVFRLKTDATGRLYVPTLYLPRAQCTLLQTNLNAAAQSLLSALLVAE